MLTSPAVNILQTRPTGDRNLFYFALHQNVCCNDVNVGRQNAGKMSFRDKIHFATSQGFTKSFKQFVLVFRSNKMSESSSSSSSEEDEGIQIIREVDVALERSLRAEVVDLIESEKSEDELDDINDIDSKIF